jgi:hypothetical protein
MTKLGMLQVIKKKKITLTDDLHVTAWGYADSLKLELMKKYYANVSFNFQYLEQAYNYFKGVIGTKNFDSSSVRCFIPSKEGPVVFTYVGDLLYSKKKKKMFFAIAPMIDDEKFSEPEAILAKINIIPKTSKISKLALFMDVLKYLEGDDKRYVKGSVLIRELVKTDKFTESEARKIKILLQRNGAIYESKPNCYNSV